MIRLVRSVMPSMASSVMTTRIAEKVGVKSISPYVTGNRYFSSTEKKEPLKPIDEVLRSIDTTLTPEQKEYADSLRKQIRGGINSPRSLYREVAKPDEVVGEGNFFPRIADNADALIDYALTFIPKKAGYRGSRQKKRMAAKWAIKEENDARRKQGERNSIAKKHEKNKKQRELVAKYKAQAKALLATNRTQTMSQTA